MTDHEAIERLKICEQCGDCLTCAEHDEAIKLALYTFKEREERAMNWISVKERLPDRDETVLCHSNKNGGYYFIGYIGYRSGAWCECGAMHIGDVTHWMPLPEPPKEE